MNKPGRPCKTQGCPNIITEGRYCTKCQPLANKADTIRRGSASKRGYDQHWRDIRDLFLAEHPLCCDPIHQGRPVLATDIDHILPRIKGGSDDPSNLQALCHSCHSRKTANSDGGFGRARQQVNDPQ